MPPYLDFLPNALYDDVRSLHQEKQTWISQPKKGFLRYRTPIEAVQHLRASSLDVADDVVRIGKKSDLSETEQEQVQQLLRLYALAQRTFFRF